MVLEINTTSKIVKIKSGGPFKEVIDTLHRLFPDFDYESWYIVGPEEEYRVYDNSPKTTYINPLVGYPATPYTNPPLDTYMTTGNGATAVDNNPF